ncbi:hypothetical protein HanPSC8_Chr16g0700041 [Helianthus annuus]|nr:hypothetical protein HanPSC8_Chr16g0700041 [Helianthus annuus]
MPLPCHVKKGLFMIVLTHNFILGKLREWPKTNPTCENGHLMRFWNNASQIPRRTLQRRLPDAFIVACVRLHPKRLALTSPIPSSDASLTQSMCRH